LRRSQRLARKREHDRDDRDEHERQPPGDLAEQPAEDRGEHQAGGLRRRERADRPAEDVGRHDLGERRQENGGEKGIRAPHGGARGEEGPDVRRESAGERGQAEGDIAASDDAPRPEALGERSGNELEQCERHHVRRDRGGDLPDRSVEPVGDVGDERNEHRSPERAEKAADVERKGDPAHAAQG
jgi:hypothetical protein